jgi:LPS sulfotransferase NodH
MSTSIQYCIIATTVRSGSTWLCDLLENNGLGHPTEHFNPSLEASAFGKAIAKGIPTEKYLEHVIGQKANHGLFFTKLLSEWLPLMRAQMSTYAVDEAHLLRTLFPSAKYIFLTREDIIAAAISSCLAEQTGA